MGGAKKKGVVGATSPWPDHSYNHQDHDQCVYEAAILSETAELKQIADRTQGLPSRDLFVWFMSSVEDLAAKVRNRASNNDSGGHSGQKEMLQQLQQIQGMLNKQTEEMKTLQRSTQPSKVTNSPPASGLSGHTRSYQDAALASHLTSTKSSLVSGWMQDATNGSIDTNKTLSTSSSSPATPFPLKEDLEIHVTPCPVGTSFSEQSLEDVEQLARAAKDWCLYFGDNTTISAPKAIVKAAVERWGCIDIIINNAGAREDYAFEEMTYEAFDRQISVNLRFPIFLIKEASSDFGKAPRIVNLSSVYARDGHPGCLAHVACKGAMESLTKSLARELGHKYHATINCVSPGPVNTELWAATVQNPATTKTWGHIIQGTPAAPRVAEVDDIAQIVAFLSEEGSRWTTGSLVNANGGLLFV